jgi:GT2 family glycosyltransferase
VDRVRSDPPAPRAGSAPSGEVSAVVVSYNTRDPLCRCLRDLEAQEGIPLLQTIVVDNGSTDGSIELLREHFSGVELVELSGNAGFAAAANLGLDRCRGEYVLLLNSDAFMHPGSLSELVGTAGRYPRAGTIGPRLLNPDGTLQRSAWPFPHAGRLLLEAFGVHRLLHRVRVLEDLGQWAHDEERSVEFLIGACLLFRAEMLAQVSGFDEAFWLYGEEADLQRRARSRGWSAVLAPAATVTHLAGASSTASYTRLRHLYAGQKLFLRKHGAPGSWMVGRFAVLAAALLRGHWTAARAAVRLGRGR